MKEAAAYCGLSERAFRAYMRSGTVVPIVPGGRGRGKVALFDYPTLNEFLGRPKQIGRPRQGLDANQPEKVQAAINAMVNDVTERWDSRSKRYLVGQAIDAGVLQLVTLRSFPPDPTEYWRHVITALFLAGQGSTFGSAWPVLLVAIQRLKVSGASIETTALHLECDRSTVRLYLDRWDQLREPREKPPRSGDVVPGRLVPLTQTEVEEIKAHGSNPELLANLPANPKWGWLTIRKMREKDPEAVRLTGRRHRTLSGVEIQKASERERPFVEFGSTEPEFQGSNGRRGYGPGGAYMEWDLAVNQEEETDDDGEAGLPEFDSREEFEAYLARTESRSFKQKI